MKDMKERLAQEIKNGKLFRKHDTCIVINGQASMDHVTYFLDNYLGLTCDSFSVQSHDKRYIGFVYEKGKKVSFFVDNVKRNSIGVFVMSNFDIYVPLEAGEIKSYILQSQKTFEQFNQSFLEEPTTKYDSDIHLNVDKDGNCTKVNDAKEKERFITIEFCDGDTITYPYTTLYVNDKTIMFTSTEEYHINKEFVKYYKTY